MPTPAYKRCNTCGEVKPLGDFHRHKSTRDGRTTSCKPCVRKRVKEWRLANPKRNAENQKRYRERHPETKVARTKRNRELHPEKTRARAAVTRAVYRNKIVKPDICERCGKRVAEPRELQAHHHDYSKPMDVEWLCQPCHMTEHGKTERLNSGA